MIRRLTLEWPRPPAGPAQSTDCIRLLAVSDERERALADARNRARIEPVDAILGCGDLEPDYLAFLGDAFHCPLIYVRGNHDRGGAWEHGQHTAPVPLGARFERICGLTVAGLSWPSWSGGRAVRSEFAAWQQVLDLWLRARLHGPAPQIVLSHVPPREFGDVAADPYHTGFAAYRWLCRRLNPLLWLHGHTTIAAADHWRTQLGSTTLLNVTGAVLIRLQAAPGWRDGGPS